MPVSLFARQWRNLPPHFGLGRTPNQGRQRYPKRSKNPAISNTHHGAFWLEDVWDVSVEKHFSGKYSIDYELFATSKQTFNF
jgi:hypothetical protein